MIRFQRSFTCCIALMLAFGLCAQTDTLLLNDGRALVGSYKVSFNHETVESKTKLNEVYKAEAVKSLSTAKKYYRVVSIHVDGVSSYYLVERLFDSKVDLYGVDFPAGHFNANSVAQSFFYFERDAKFTYVNKANLEAFYRSYFSTCYDAIAKKTYLYNEGSVANMLNAYNHCLDPVAPQKVLEPSFTEYNLSAFGGIGSLTHYPQQRGLKGREFDDNAKHFGLGFSFVYHQKTRLGVEIVHGQHEIAYSPSLAVVNSPIYGIGRLRTIGLNLTVAYIFRLKNLSLEPRVSAGAGKIYDTSELPIKEGIYIDFINPPKVRSFSFEEPFYSLNVSGQLGYQVVHRLALFARAGFSLTTTKSITGDVEDVHVIDGLLITGGVSFKFKN